MAQHEDQQVMALTGLRGAARPVRDAGADARAGWREVATLVVTMAGCGAMVVLELATAVYRR